MSAQEWIALGIAAGILVVIVSAFWRIILAEDRKE
jgi:hypothetical protein